METCESRFKKLLERSPRITITKKTEVDSSNKNSKH
jgi:hypothetical protein